jgi:hypothetical protein
MERKLQLSSAGAQGGKQTQRFQPLKRREVLQGLINGVTGSVVVDWPDDEVKRVFDNASRDEVSDMIDQVKEAGAVFATLASKLTKIRDGKKTVNVTPWQRRPRLPTGRRWLLSRLPAATFAEVRGQEHM